jgi:outer membrane protein insertion porin family
MNSLTHIHSFAPPRSAVLLGLVLCAVSVQAQDSPRKLTVADVIVRGNTRKSTQEIMAMLKTRVGAEYNPETIQEDVRTLMATDQFGMVQARYQPCPDGQVVVSFLIVDYPNVIEEVVFDGLKSLSRGDLEKAIRVKKGDPLNPPSNQAACRTIVRQLQDKGRPFASCKLIEGTQPTDKRVVFSVTEGPQVFVRGIEFTGNSFVSSGVLKTHIDSKTGLLGISQPSAPYIPAMADNDVNKLLEYYRGFGFHDVKVSREVKWEQDSKTVTLVFHVNEGLRYRVKAAPEIRGNTSAAKEELRRVIRVKPDTFFDQSKIDKDVTRLEDYIGSRGTRARVEPGLVHTASGECVVRYEVQERPAARVGQIFIIGNTKTIQSIILERVQLFPGQLLSYAAIRASERALVKLGLFVVKPELGIRPTVRILDEQSDSVFKDILVEIQEVSEEGIQR